MADAVDRYDYLEFKDSHGKSVKCDEKIGTSSWTKLLKFTNCTRLTFAFRSDSSGVEWGYKFKVHIMFLLLLIVESYKEYNAKITEYKNTKKCIKHAQKHRQVKSVSYLLLVHIFWFSKAAVPCRRSLYDVSKLRSSVPAHWFFHYVAIDVFSVKQCCEPFVQSSWYSSSFWF